MIQTLFASIGSRLAFVVGVMVTGFMMIAVTGFTMFGEIQRANDTRSLLLSVERSLEQFRVSIIESIVLIDRLVFEGDESVIPRLLALSENSLGYFGQYQSNAENFGLEVDSYAAEEHESLVLQIRTDSFKLVSLYRSGNKQLAAEIRKTLIKKRIPVVNTFINNAAELRNFALEDEDKRIESLERLITKSSIVIFFAVTLLTSFIAVLVIRSITRPLAKLNLAIDLFSPADQKSNFPFDHGIFRNDEVGRLATSFESLARQLLEHERKQAEFIEQLEQKNSELERFTYTVSHDLKSPLVTVRGFIGLLEKDIELREPEKIRHDIGRITEATDTMQVLLENLLELSRIGRVVHTPEMVSLTQLCQEVVTTMQITIEEHAAEIKFSADMPAIYADKVRIKEVLQNLLENSIKFSSEDNRPHIEISAHREQEHVVCRVRDNGIGIDPRYHDKVFGLFERLDAQVAGTGVGLAVVKRIIEFHGGKIWIESQGDRQGTVFCFTLPNSGDYAI